jgi:hypothetical protein
MAYEVVFVSLHNDNVWWLDWVTHKGAHDLFTPEFSADISLIGCDPVLKQLNLEQH